MPEIQPPSDDHSLGYYVAMFWLSPLLLVAMVTFALEILRDSDRG